IAIQRRLAARPSPAEEAEGAGNAEDAGKSRKSGNTGGAAAPAAAASVPSRAGDAGPPPAREAGAAAGAAPRGASLLVVDRPRANARLAGCCTPVPPDAITGFVVRGGAVTVHRVECATVARMKSAGRAEVDVR